MISVAALYQKLEERIPPSLSCDWDNDGMMCCPLPGRPSQRVLVTLDITDLSVSYAVAHHFDAVVSHHPLLFRGIRHLEPGDAVARKTIDLCRAGIAAFSFHTRLDALPGGVNDTLADCLGLTGVTPFGTGPVMMGRIGEYSCASATEFARHVAKRLHTSGVLLSDAGRPVRRVAILGGEGGDEWEAARSCGADTYVSGRIGYHRMMDAPEAGINLIEAGHYSTEFPVCYTLERWIREISPESYTEVFSGNEGRIQCISESLTASDTPSCH